MVGFTKLNSRNYFLGFYLIPLWDASILLECLIKTCVEYTMKHTCLGWFVEKAVTYYFINSSSR